MKASVAAKITQDAITDAQFKVDDLLPQVAAQNYELIKNCASLGKGQAYLDFGQSLVTDLEKELMKNALTKHFTDLGYSISVEKDHETNSTTFGLQVRWTF